MTKQFHAYRSNVALLPMATSVVLNQQAVPATTPPTLGSIYPPEIASGALLSQRVLVVEDNDDLREIMSTFLGHEGYSVTSCCDAQVASKVFRSDPLIGTLMTDLEMPGRSGLELARELTSIRPSLPVMIFSGAYISFEMSVEMRDRNWQFLAKPSGLPTVLKVLHALHNQQSQGRAV